MSVTNSKSKSSAFPVHLFDDEVITSTARLGDLQREKNRSKRTGLTRGLLAVSVILCFYVGYSFVVNGNEPNWFGAVATLGIGYVLYRAFTELEEYERHIEYAVKRIESAKFYGSNEGSK